LCFCNIVQFTRMWIRNALLNLLLFPINLTYTHTHTHTHTPYYLNSLKIDIVEPWFQVAYIQRSFQKGYRIHLQLFEGDYIILYTLYKLYVVIYTFVLLLLIIQFQVHLPPIELNIYLSNSFYVSRKKYIKLFCSVTGFLSLLLLTKIHF